MDKHIRLHADHLQDEPEETRASLWYKVARNATDKQEQAKAFQEAITTLKVRGTTTSATRTVKMHPFHVSFHSVPSQ